MVEIRVHERKSQKRPIFITHPLDRRQVEVRWRLPVPGLLDLGEGMFGHRTPKDQLALEVIGDQRMLEAGTLGDPSNARRLKAALRELGERRVQDRESRVD